MGELQKILQTAEDARREGENGILATVVNARGSVYRRAGARLLFTENGFTTGGVSGGCLENDVIERAKPILEKNTPELITYDTTSTDKDLIWGLGLGCKGLVEVLIEPLQSHSVTRFLRFILITENATSSAVVFRSDNEKFPVGRRSYAFLENGQIICEDEMFLDDHTTAFNQRKARVITFSPDEKPFQMLFEPIPKTTRIILCGAGNDAIPVAEMAHLLDWEVILIDHRKGFANVERFPKAARILNIRPEKINESLTVESRDAFVIMTHHFQFDREILQIAFQTEAFYIGALGPRRRAEQILAELEKDSDSSFNKAQKERLHAPIGLDIGSETPSEIALSVLSEIQAKITKRNGKCLRERNGSIH